MAPFRAALEGFEIVGEILVVLDEVAAATGESGGLCGQRRPALAARLERGREQWPTVYAEHLAQTLHAVARAGEVREQSVRQAEVDQARAGEQRGIAEQQVEQRRKLWREAGHRIRNGGQVALSAGIERRDLLPRDRHGHEDRGVGDQRFGQFDGLLVGDASRVGNASAAVQVSVSDAQRVVVRGHRRTRGGRTSARECTGERACSHPRDRNGRRAGAASCVIAGRDRAARFRYRRTVAADAAPSRGSAGDLP